MRRALLAFQTRLACTRVLQSSVRNAVVMPPEATAALATRGIDVPLLRSGHRRPLAKAITLVESSNPRDALTIGALLRSLRDLEGTAVAAPSSLESRPKKKLKRVAISGSPGAGKSCFIEAMGMHLARDLNLKVGVVAVDPSSSVNGGSILGDKTRMEQLSLHPNAFVRPSPSRGHLGGVTARCWEVMELLEAADFDVILVETVGVGQSEFEAKNLTDVFVLLVPPASGDELQGIKKGIVEVADVILVTKYDGEKKSLADQTRSAYTRAVQFRSDCTIPAKPVLCVSSEEGTNIPEAWTTLDGLWNQLHDSGQLMATRKAQQLTHFHQYFAEELVARAMVERIGQGKMLWLEDLVVRGQLSPREAGEEAIQMAFSSST